MPCSQCDEWVDEWIQWRRYDHDVQHPRALRYWLSRYDGLWWFFFCSSCREREPWLKSWYVNADGGISTDSDTDSTMADAEMAGHATEQPAVAEPVYQGAVSPIAANATERDLQMESPQWPEPQSPEPRKWPSHSGRAPSGRGNDRGDSTDSRGRSRCPGQSLTAPPATKQRSAPAMTLKRCGRLLAALFHRPITGTWNWNYHFGHCGQSCPCCRWAVTQSTKGDDYFGTCGHCETARALRAPLFRISQFRPISHIDTAVLATRISSSYQLGCFSDDVFESDAESD